MYLLLVLSVYLPPSWQQSPGRDLRPSVAPWVARCGISRSRDLRTERTTAVCPAYYFLVLKAFRDPVHGETSTLQQTTPQSVPRPPIKQTNRALPIIGRGYHRPILGYQRITTCSLWDTLPRQGKKSTSLYAAQPHQLQAKLQGNLSTTHHLRT